MKKIFCLLALLLLFQGSSFAVNFGSYKAETDYGLLDGFKFNFFNKEGKPLVELKSETQEEKERLEREKDKPKEVQDDVRLYRFMLEDTVAF